MAAAKVPDLLDEFRKESTNCPGTKCSVGALLRSLPPELADDVRTALADASITSTAISRVLTNRGFQIAHSPIVRHRRGECRCERH